MTEEQEYQKNFGAALAALGLSADKIAYINRVKGDKAVSKLYLWGSISYIALMVACMLGYVFLARVIFSNALMAHRTQGIDYIFYDSTCMTNLAVMMFVSIIFPAWFLYKLLDYFPKASVMVAVKSFDQIAQINMGKLNLGATGKFSSWYVKSLIDATFLAMPIEQGLDHLNRKSRKWLVKCIFWLCLAALPLMVLDAANYTLVTPDGVLQRGYASFKTRENPWSEVTRIETGCYYFTGKNSNLGLKYTIIFTDGSDIDLFDAKSDKDPITQISAIDTKLRELNKPFTRKMLTFGLHKGEPYLNDACHPQLRQQYPTQYDQLIQLLRL